jgi:hypothetical protein
VEVNSTSGLLQSCDRFFSGFYEQMIRCLFSSLKVVGYAGQCGVSIDSFCYRLSPVANRAMPLTRIHHLEYVESSIFAVYLFDTISYFQGAIGYGQEKIDKQ